MSAARQPVLFSEKVKGAKKGGGYPVQIKAEDLDKNFTLCVVEYADTSFTEEATTGAGGHKARKIKLLVEIPSPPTSGTHVLGVIDGVVQWIETEACS